MPDTPFTATLALDTYPERAEQQGNWFDDGIATLLGKIRVRKQVKHAAFVTFYNAMKEQIMHLKGMNETDYSEYVSKLRYAMVRDGLTDAHITNCFALIYYTCFQKLKMRPYKVQVLAGWVMIQGKLAEMATGEGKTLAATFPACTAAMAKVPVHVITANEYLASRDAALMQPLYQALGLTVGVITSESSIEERRAAYDCHITYCTSKQLALDYLRDRMKQGLQNKTLRHQLKRQDQSAAQLPLLRGLCYAIVDEADSVLIDDARVPLILAKNNTSNPELTDYFEALAIAELLKQDEDFQLNQAEPKVKLTEQGQQRLTEITKELDTAWTARDAESLVLMALRAQYVLQRDKDYLLKDNGIEIIDENTGRSVPDRSWQKGLQQIVECKEGCSLSSEKSILARISFQRFFRRYLQLAGMTGTAREVAGELKRIYELEVVPIPTRTACRRKMLPERIYPTAAVKWLICVKRIQKIHSRGRPILIGTRSIKDSEYLSLLLDKAGLAHQVLNAHQDKDEAIIIASAGKKGQITIATNMAGRGTDIKLSKESKQAGGLHVISVELNDARRIDRQLYGRCARQGNRGSCEAIISLEDGLFEHIPQSLRQKLIKLSATSGYLPLWLSRILTHWAQWVKQTEHSKLRNRLLKWDQQQDRTLAFSGKRE